MAATSAADETTRLSVLSRIVAPEAIPPEAARYLLGLRFPQRDIERMNALAQKSQQGTLTATERLEIESYCVANDLLGMLQARARTALNKSGHDQ